MWPLLVGTVLESKLHRQNLEKGWKDGGKLSLQLVSTWAAVPHKWVYGLK
jgi:hypothetical protein